ncbi:MAG: DUF2784 domain-containing protein [Magnetococcales bacterium]|nr:DUF2784 domain-containing protein [Magnetococcales bacterium]
MIYRIMADIVIVFHCFFVLFVFLGGLFVLRQPKLAWVHFPAAIWGAGIGLGFWFCPLTTLENSLRNIGVAQGYPSSFVDQFILPLIYPELWFSSGFPGWGFTAIGLFILFSNAAIYRLVWQKYKASNR